MLIYAMICHFQLCEIQWYRACLVCW